MTISLGRAGSNGRSRLDAEVELKQAGLVGLDLWKMELVIQGQKTAGEAEEINTPALDEDESSGTRTTHTPLWG